MRYDGLHNNVKYSTAINPSIATSDNTAIVSAIVDTQGYNVVEFIGTFGNIADADCTLAVTVQDGDAANLSDAATVDSSLLLGSTALGLQFDSDNKTFKIGYLGAKRYVRVTITPSANTGNVFASGVWALSGARKTPLATQVV